MSAAYAYRERLARELAFRQINDAAGSCGIPRPDFDRNWARRGEHAHDRWYAVGTGRRLAAHSDCGLVERVFA